MSTLTCGALGLAGMVGGSWNGNSLAWNAGAKP